MFCRRDFRSGKKRGPKVGKTKRGKGSKLMVLVDGQGTPLGIHVDSASPAEVKLLKTTMEKISVGGKRGRPRKKPDRLVMDRAYDSNPLRKELDSAGIEPIVPARKNNKKATHQDGRKMRRYSHRWIIERTNAWLHNFRRLSTRFERSAVTYEGLVQLACAMITLRRVLK